MIHETRSIRTSGVAGALVQAIRDEEMFAAWPADVRTAAPFHDS
jgi:hypothetical protein